MGRQRSEEKDFFFGFRFISSLLTVLPYLYGSEFFAFDSAFLCTLLTMATAAGGEVVTYHSGTIVGQFYNVLIGRNESAFWVVYYKASLIYFGQTLLLAIVSLCSWLLYICMRKNLVLSLHKLYFSKRVYYRLNAIDNEGIDNPDQRITQDCERMCTILAKQVLPYLLIFPGVICYYTVATWKNAGWIGVAMIYTYFAIGFVVNRLLNSPITKWTARVEKAEGDFRFKHVSVRNYAEEIAFYDASNAEKQACDNSFMVLLRRQLKLNLWEFPAKFLQYFIDYYGGVFSYLIQIFPIFIFHWYNDLDPGTLAEKISNNAFYFIYLINSFSRLTDLFLNLGEMAAYTQRIAQLINASREANHYEPLSGAWSDTDEVARDPLTNSPLSTEILTVAAPSESAKPLISDLSMKLPVAKTLLITGGSGVGKTSLLRVIKHLWQPKYGNVKLSTNDVMFLPQRPYLPVGRLTLRQQIMYPQFVDSTNESNEVQPLEAVRFEKILFSLGLQHLIAQSGGLDERPHFEWQETLSPGEQQRLSIARLLHRRPVVAVLDEATSSLSEQAELHIYNLIREANIIYISTGHRHSLLALHDFELHLNGGNDWRIEEIQQHEQL